MVAMDVAARRIVRVLTFLIRDHLVVVQRLDDNDTKQWRECRFGDHFVEYRPEQNVQSLSTALATGEPRALCPWAEARRLIGENHNYVKEITQRTISLRPCDCFEIMRRLSREIRLIQIHGQQEFAVGLFLLQTVFQQFHGFNGVHIGQDFP